MRTFALSLVLSVLCAVHPSLAVGQLPREELDALQLQLEQQAAEIEALRNRLDERDEPFRRRTVKDEAACEAHEFRRLPVVVDEQLALDCEGNVVGDDKPFRQFNYFAEYNQGFRIRPVNPEQHPFELKVNGWIQMRHHGFARDVDSWTDSAGVTRPVRNRNAFDIERGRLIFSGFAVDQRLTYFLHLDGDTDGGHFVDFFDYWWAWRFSDSLQVQLGKRKVPASRQWLLTARMTRFVDRPMANDFFRPDRTVGLFANGALEEWGHYEVMVGNGYNTSNLTNAQGDDRFTFAATHFIDPLGDYGSQIVDFDYTCDPLVRLGQSVVYSPQASDVAGRPMEEGDFLRLTDGTRLTQIGALAPGVTVSNFDVFLYGVDAAMKWRGLSANAEVFLRWIEGIAGDGPLPETELFQHGFYVEGGYFVIPQRFDINARYSQVSGAQGTGSEYSAAVNWYPLAKPQLKITADVTKLDGSPLNNTASDILVGDSGWLFRTQFQAEF